MTLTELAERAEIAVSTISKLENGRINPSVGTMHKITRALNLNIGALFPASATTELIARAGTRPLIGDPSCVQLERLVEYGTNHLLQANIHIMAPGSGSDGEMQHEGEEVGYVLSGGFELTIDGLTMALGVGDSFSFDSRLRHSYRNPGEEECRVIWVNTPPTF